MSSTPHVACSKGSKKLKRRRKGYYDSIDNLMLISQVKSHKCLYDPDSPDCRKILVRKEAWDNISRNIVGRDKWASLSFADKRKIGKDIITRWNILQRSHNRFLQLKKTNPRFEYYYKNHHALYEKEMQFLLPGKLKRRSLVHSKTDNNCSVIEDRELELDGTEALLPSSGTSVGMTEQKHPGREFQSSNLMTKQNAPLADQPSLDQPTPVCQPTLQQSPVCQSTTQPTPACQLTFQPTTGLQPKTTPHKEEDKMFLLSLLPHMQKMTNYEKIDFKINLMQFLKTNGNTKEKTTRNLSTSAPKTKEIRIFKIPIIKL